MENMLVGLGRRLDKIDLYLSLIKRVHGIRDGSKIVFLLQGQHDVKACDRIVDEAVRRTIDDGVDVKYSFHPIKSLDPYDFLEDVIRLINGFGGETSIWAMECDQYVAGVLTLVGNFHPMVSKTYLYSELVGGVILVPKIADGRLLLTNKEYRLIDILMRSADGLRVRDIAISTNSSYQSVHRIIRSLIRKGYVVKTRGRGVRYRLTNKGRIVFLIPRDRR